MRVTRVLAYRRVATGGQTTTGTTLEAQKKEIERYCATQGWPDPVDYVEVASSGRGAEVKRPEAMRLLAEVRAGDAVIVGQIDRFARDVKFIIKHVRSIEKKGACFVSIAESFDSRCPKSELLLGVWAMIANFGG
jgi:DNA invertase Pin-like site-specific DNA recombinase